MNLKHLFLVKSATLATTPPPGGWPATGLPSGVWSLVQVESWFEDRARDAWETLPDVVELPFTMLDQMIPGPAQVVLAPWGVVVGDTLRAALRKIRAQWPGARHD